MIPNIIRMLLSIRMRPCRGVSMADNTHFTRGIPVATEGGDGPVEMTVEGEDAFAAAEAVGSEPRWRLLAAVADEPHTINQLVDRLDLSKGTISVHISKFEDVGIVEANYTVTDDGGVKKEVALAVDRVTLDFASL